MAEPVENADTMRFGRFELSADTGELRKDGIRLKLSGQAMSPITTEGVEVRLSGFVETVQTARHGDRVRPRGSLSL